MPKTEIKYLHIFVIVATRQNTEFKFLQKCTHQHTEDLYIDNKRQICDRSGAYQTWQCNTTSYNAHKVFSDGNREIDKCNMVPCHLPSLPPSVS